jgi:hypothetical protein
MEILGSEGVQRRIHLTHRAPTVLDQAFESCRLMVAATR